MKASITLLVTFLIVCLESTILKGIAIRGITPNLLLVMVLSYGVLRGSFKGGAIGFLAGLLLDLSFHQSIGFQTLIYFYVGVVAGYFNKDFYKENYVLPILLICGTDFVYGFFMYVFTYLLRGKLDIGYYMGNIVIPEMIYTLLMGIFLYRFLSFIESKVDEYHKGRYSKF